FFTRHPVRIGQNFPRQHLTAGPAKGPVGGVILNSKDFVSAERTTHGRGLHQPQVNLRTLWQCLSGDTGIVQHCSNGGIQSLFVSVVHTHSTSVCRGAAHRASVYRGGGSQSLRLQGGGSQSLRLQGGGSQSRQRKFIAGAGDPVTGLL